MEKVGLELVKGDRKMLLAFVQRADGSAWAGEKEGAEGKRVSLR